MVPRSDVAAGCAAGAGSGTAVSSGFLARPVPVTRSNSDRPPPSFLGRRSNPPILEVSSSALEPLTMAATSKGSAPVAGPSMASSSSTSTARCGMKDSTLPAPGMAAGTRGCSSAGAASAASGALSRAAMGSASSSATASMASESNESAADSATSSVISGAGSGAGTGSSRMVTIDGVAAFGSSSGRGTRTGAMRWAWFRICRCDGCSPSAASRPVATTDTRMLPSID